MNIAEILKDKPKGTKLWSPAFGSCTFQGIGKNIAYPIEIEPSTMGIMPTRVSKEGKFYNIQQTECILFPSMFMRDWAKFQWKRGDILTTEDNTKQCIFDGWYKDDYTQIKAKHWLDCSNDNNHRYLSENQPLTELLCKATSGVAKCYINTIEERINGKLNLETLEIEPIKQECTFKPFDKVLVRGNENYNWRVDLFSHSEESYAFCIGGAWKYCIPYEGNEHLLGTTNSH